MNVFMRNLLGLSAAAAIGAAGISSAEAGGFAIREQSAHGMGAAFAGAAANGAGLGSMFWNPAIMTQYHGWNTSVNGSLIVPDAKVRTTFPAVTNSGTITQGALAPATYTSFQINDRIWVGLATTSRFGLVTKYPFNNVGQFYARTSRVFSINFNPNIAYKVNQWLSIGAGLQVEYFKTRLTSANPLSPPPFATTILKGDSYAIGFTLGALVTPWEGTAIGIGYRSRMNHKLEGLVANFPGVPVPLNIRSNLVLPDQITIGLRQRITPQFTLLAGLEWTNWSVFNSFPVVSTGPVAAGATITSLDFRWRDGWYASVGGEYQWNEKLKVRGGLGYEWSPVSNRIRGQRLPDQNRVWASIGMSYQLTPALSLDASYTHLFIPKAPIRVVPGNPTFNPLLGAYRATAKAKFDMFSVGLNYRFGGRAPTVVAKY